MYQTDNGSRYWAEGAYYFNYALIDVVPFWHAVRANGMLGTVNDPFNSSWFLNPVEWLADISTPDGLTPPLDDGNKHRMSAAPMLRWASVYGSEDVGKKFNFIYQTTNQYFQNTSRSEYIFNNNTYLTELAIPKLNQSQVTPIDYDIVGSGEQQLILRNYDNNGRLHYLLLNGEKGNAIKRGEGHEQPDQLQVLYYVDDTSYLMDAGYDDAAGLSISTWNRFNNHNVLFPLGKALRTPEADEGFRMVSNHNAVQSLNAEINNSITVLKGNVEIQGLSVNDGDYFADYRRHLVIIDKENNTPSYVIDVNSHDLDENTAQGTNLEAVYHLQYKSDTQNLTHIPFEWSSFIFNNKPNLFLFKTPIAITIKNRSTTAETDFELREKFNGGNNYYASRIVDQGKPDLTYGKSTVSFLQISDNIPNLPERLITYVNNAYYQAYLYKHSQSIMDVFVQRVKVDGRGGTNSEYFNDIIFDIPDANYIELKLPSGKDFGFARLKINNGVWEIDSDYQINLTRRPNTFVYNDGNSIGNKTFPQNSNIYIADNAKVNITGNVSIQDWSTVYLGKDAIIEVSGNGNISATQTTFQTMDGSVAPADRWKHIKLLTNNNTFTSCTIEGADKGLYVASSGNIIQGGSIRNNGIGIYLSSGNATLEGAIVDGPGDGAVVRGTATLYTEHSSQTPGWATRIRNNDRGIDISDFGRAVVYHTLIQQNDYGVYISGDGDLENDGSLSGQGYGSYQPDAQTNYDIFNISSQYASAHFNFWGSYTDPPLSSRFYGSVGYQNPLSCDPTVTQQHCDPIDEGGGGDPCDPMFPCENSTIQTTTPELVAGSSAAGSTVSNDPSFDLTQKIKEIIQNVYSHIEEHPNDPGIYRYVERIHDLLAVYDKDNSIRSWANFDQKLNSWSNLYKLSQDFSGGMELEGTTLGSTSPLLDHLPVLKKLGQTTMLITLNDLLHQADYEQALLLANRYESYMDLPANQVAILAAKAVAWEQTKQYGKALAAYEQIENIDLNIKGDPDFKAPDYSAVKEELADSMAVRNQVKSMPISENQAKQREITETPREFGVGAPYPNPFNPTTTIPFTLPVQSTVKIDIYNMLGRKVATLADRVYEAGQHQVQINGDHLSSGIYFIRSDIGGNSYLNKITLVK